MPYFIPEDKGMEILAQHFENFIPKVDTYTYDIRQYCSIRLRFINDGPLVNGQRKIRGKKHATTA